MDFSSLSADTAHRFRAVAELLHEHGQQLPTRPKLLDVGGYPGTFAREFTTLYPRWQAITLDQPKENLPDYVSASGAKIPFPDASFDAVISVDTYEHIAPGERERFLQEICRVSGGIVVLAAPFHHEATAAVERILDLSHQKLFGLPHPWLHEHVQYGLPPLMKTVGGWPPGFGIVELRSSYDLQSWTSWQALSMFRKLKGDMDKAWNAFDSACAESMTPAVTRVPYRWIFVAKRGEKSIDVAAGRIPPPEAGQEVVELARLYSRMLEISAGEAVAKAESGGSIAVEERLKQAMQASEAQIAQLKAQIARQRKAPSSDSILRPGAFFRLFKR